MKTALKLQGIVKRYGSNTALNRLDLIVPRGSIFGLVGSNGAGKTTAMSVGAGLLRHEAGLVSLLDEGPFNPGIHAGRVALLPQDARLPPHLRVEQVLVFYGRLQGIGGDSISEAVEKALAWTNLSGKRRAEVHELSHGMYRRLAIAQAFLGHPEFIMLDEPLSGLDPREQVRIREVILGKTQNQTILISSHQMSDIESLCTEVAFIEGGRLIRQDTMSRITSMHNTVSYIVSTGNAVDIDYFRSVLGQAEWWFEPRACALCVRFPDAMTVEEVNRKVIPAILQHGLELREVRQGVSLEDEYMKIVESHAPQKPASSRGF
jgi:ABC-2 type transport system ATP-binding protein